MIPETSNTQKTSEKKKLKIELKAMRIYGVVCLPQPALFFGERKLAVDIEN